MISASTSYATKEQRLPFPSRPNTIPTHFPLADIDDMYLSRRTTSDGPELDTSGHFRFRCGLPFVWRLSLVVRPHSRHTHSPRAAARNELTASGPHLHSRSAGVGFRRRRGNRISRRAARSSCYWLLSLRLLCLLKIEIIILYNSGDYIRERICNSCGRCVNKRWKCLYILLAWLPSYAVCYSRRHRNIGHWMVYHPVISGTVRCRPPQVVPFDSVRYRLVVLDTNSVRLVKCLSIDATIWNGVVSHARVFQSQTD